VHLAFTSAGPIAMRADADDIRAAVSNLLDNAVKYSAKPAQVEVETRVVDGKYVQLRVRDEGPGIAKGELKQIFKRFYRIPGALAGKVKGTGLGLFIVRSVAQRHGGKAWAESDGLGSGSTFILQLPLKT
jgi:two-component system, OmpR family, sensor histidine kinase SenX3